MFGSGLITAAMCSGNNGNSEYKSEPKHIVENGEYVPETGVRWSKVTVDVPQGGNGNEIVEKIKGLESAGGYDFGDGFYADVCTDINGEIMGIGVAHITSDTNYYFVGTRVWSTGEVIDGKDVLAPVVIVGLCGVYIRVYKDGNFVFAFTGNPSSGYANPLTKKTRFGTFSTVTDDIIDYRLGWQYKKYPTGVKLSPYSDGSIFSTTFEFKSEQIGGQWVRSGLTKFSIQASLEYTYEERSRSQKRNSSSFEFDEIVYEGTGYVSAIGSIRYWYNYSGIPLMVTDLDSFELSTAVAGFLGAVYKDKYNGLTLPEAYDFKDYLV